MRGGKKDRTVTDTLYRTGMFRDERSYYSTDGRIFLYGVDWGVQKGKVVLRDEECRACGHRSYMLDVDHIKKRSDGGDDSIDNLQLLCRDCHNQKHKEKRVRWSSMKVGG